jgi:N-acylethanolamine-hydrolysing acid amidase
MTKQKLIMIDGIGANTSKQTFLSTRVVVYKRSRELATPRESMMDTRLQQLIFLLILFVSHDLSAGHDLPIPSYEINLEDPPEERWKDIAIRFGPQMASLNEYIRNMMRISNPIGLVMMDIMGAELGNHFPDPYAKELEGFVKYSNITAGEIVLWNVLYETTAYYHGGATNGDRGCTGVVARMSDGTIIHGRNLDYGIGLLRDMAINVVFKKGNEIVYTGTTFAGYIGLMTAQKPNKFTISMNERDKGSWEQNDVVAMATGTAGLIALKIRDILNDPGVDFEKAITLISNSQFIAPCYVILGGLRDNEGAVITHNRSSADVWRLDDNNWYLVETNYDHLDQPPASDDRRDPAINMMDDIGKDGINNSSLYNVLSKPPVLNDGTIFSVVMSASQPSLYNGWIRQPN